MKTLKVSNGLAYPGDAVKYKGKPYLLLYAGNNDWYATDFNALFIVAKKGDFPPNELKV